jgi:hypothetical protein
MVGDVSPHSFRHCHRGIRRRSLQNGYELIPAVPEHDVGDAKGSSREPSHVLQHFIAGLSTVQTIEVLEADDIY